MFLYSFWVKGKFMGYHADSFCSVYEEIEHAKRYTTEKCSSTGEFFLERIRKNFKYIWHNYESYRKDSFWQGAEFEDIEIRQEEKDIPKHREVETIAIVYPA